MPIVQQGSLNTTALVVPDLYVQIVPPSVLVLNGVPSNRIGVVGTAQWGPVNHPVIVGTMAEFSASFGAVQARKYDLGTHVAIAVQQGASDFRCVRVTDGTDVAATATLAGTLSDGLVLTALYTGTLGNQITATIATGTKIGSYKLVVGVPGLTPEVYDNITGTGTAFWTALAAAVNSGTGVLRGPSQLVSAAVTGSYAAAPAAGTVTLTGGTDGATTITSATLIGVDTTPRTGMYALRGQGCSIGDLADADDSPQWTTQSGFGLSEGVYMMLVAPAGSAIANGTNGTVDLRAAAGLDSYSCKLMHGDWIYWNDQVNAVTRLVSPQAFVAGRLANLSPEQSSLNKQLYGVVGSQKSGAPGSGQFGQYSAADLTALFSAGIDVISNPQPGGAYWGVRRGCNSSSNAAENGDNYTRMTNYIAATLNAGMGLFVGQVINATLLGQIRATLLSFLQNMLQQGMLGTTNGSIPFSVVCDTTNNPLSRTSLGYVQADVQVQYMGIALFLIVNLQGGQTVTITQQPSFQTA